MNKSKKPSKKDIKNRKILKVKAPSDPKTLEPVIEVKEKQKEEEKEKEQSEHSEEENENPNQVRLEELLDDLKLDDDIEEDANDMKEKENIVENFIKQMDQVKISKE